MYDRLQLVRYISSNRRPSRDLPLPYPRIRSTTDPQHNVGVVCFHTFSAPLSLTPDLNLQESTRKPIIASPSNLANLPPLG